ncbi:hypothetical protein [Burkholderia ubonensis]|uniref:hypothetical protein n=1 Tax=Burkholderia ubonensis TaxID=101571 RepID=UPI000B1051DF|nr:hypothetical protein [Burkholderia ubonensis]
MKQHRRACDAQAHRIVTIASAQSISALLAEGERGGFDARIRPPDVAIPAAGMPDDGASRPKKLSRRNVSRLPFSQV